MIDVKEPLFTDENRRAIAGYGRHKEERYLSITDLIEVKYRDNIVKFMDETGFKPSNISSILHSAGEKAEEAIKSLTSDDSIKRFKKLLVEQGDNPPLFKPKNISSMLNGSGGMVGERIKAISSPKSLAAFRKLIFGTGDKTVVFSPANVSSILGGSKNHLTDAIQALASSDAISGFRILMEIGFSASNISSMLNRSGEVLEEAIKAITSPEVLEGFRKLIGTQEEPGMLSTRNVSSMFHAAGIRIPESMKEVLDREDKMEYLLSQLEVAQLSTELNGNARSDLGKAIDDLYAVVKDRVDQAEALINVGEVDEQTIAEKVREFQEGLAVYESEEELDIYQPPEIDDGAEESLGDVELGDVSSPVIFSGLEVRRGGDLEKVIRLKELLDKAGDYTSLTRIVAENPSSLDDVIARLSASERDGGEALNALDTRLVEELKVPEGSKGRIAEQSKGAKKMQDKEHQK